MSSSNQVQQQLKPIYQCDSQVHRTLRSVREHLHQLCGRHCNRLVVVETMDGEVYEGYIRHCHNGILYLTLSNEGCSRAFFPGPVNPYSNFVLPLVLFNLLTISLL
ncbi:hypothetical protein [Cohnella cellulosilytica]|uniref:Acetyl-CoA acetyltransferase n=1 Tax=Cohnella cellulosilytica TaxID=986710 RepID=A0ABW2FGT7_9BACL